MHNIALIGMPGAGKSSVGAALARRSNATFIDTDRLIEARHGARLQTLLEQHGYQWLRAAEAQVILLLRLPASQKYVIATGGSVIYSEQAMAALAAIAATVYLKISAQTMISRVRAEGEEQRGLARPACQTLEALYREREPLYARAAMRTVDCDGLAVEEVVEQLCAGV
ncbi:MAG: shikimate kinase [Pseudomonadales bacterium]